MRPAGSRLRLPALLVTTLLTVAAVCAVVAGMAGQARGVETTTTITGAQTATQTTAGSPGTTGPSTGVTTGVTTAPAIVQASPLAVSVDRPLSLVSEGVTVKIEGDLGRSLAGNKLVVRVKGPADPEEIGTVAPELKEVDKVVAILGAKAATPTTTTTAVTETEGEPATTTSSSTTTTTLRIKGIDDAGLTAGALSVSVPLAANRPKQPGAYLLVVEVKNGPVIVATGQAWIGKAAAREKPLDLAFVWPVSLGVHRDAGGVFYDTAFEDALGIGDTTNVDAADNATLLGVAKLTELFPAWSFTLAVEPVLVTQLRDMADGYTRRDASGAETEVPVTDPRAQNADALLAALKKEADGGSVDIAVSPYAGADLSVLAAEGWRDGFEQIQMGKQELQQTLGLDAPLTGALSPKLDLSSSSLTYYADASIDHVVVGSQLAAMLTEEVDPGAIAVRTRDDENHRATLIFADAGLGSRLAEPWDPNLFFAALAAELAADPREAVVVAPALQFRLVPDAYLESVGSALQDLSWVRTLTLNGLLREHSPGTRPIMLKTTAEEPAGYIESEILAGLRSAHEVVTDLAAIADATRTPVETVHRLLYIAESAWWWRPGTSPGQATIGLEYARRATELAKGELDKITFAGVDSGIIRGSEGTVSLTLENKADYEVTVAVQLGGTGLDLPAGDTVEVDLQPGKTVLPVTVGAGDGSHKLDAKLVAGEATLDEVTTSVRFLTIRTVLPAIIVGGLAFLVGLYFLGRRFIKRWPRLPGWIRIHRPN
jgi:hypothetical protein